MHNEYPTIDDGQHDLKVCLQRIRVLEEQLELQRSGERCKDVRQRQAETLARFCIDALRVGNLEELFDIAVGVVSDTLGYPFAEIYKLSIDQKKFLMVANRGLDTDTAQRFYLDSEHNHQIAFTLKHSGPVVVTDLRKETRFSGPAHLRATRPAN